MFRGISARPRQPGLHEKTHQMNTPLPQETDEEAGPDTENVESTSSQRVGPFAKLLSVLDLFSAERTSVNIDEAIAFLGVGKSTGYKHLKDMCDSGLLVQRGKGEYALGPRIIELERLLQVSDPFLIAGKAAMVVAEELCENRALMLCTLYQNRVLCVHSVGPESIRYGKEYMRIYRARGTALPLFKGAGSHAILAHLLPHQIRSLYLSNASEIAMAGLGSEWKDFRSALARVRKAGFATSVGQINPNMLSISVPVFFDERVHGSLLLLTTNSSEEKAMVDQLAGQLTRIAGRIEQLMAEGSLV